MGIPKCTSILRLEAAFFYVSFQVGLEDVEPFADQAPLLFGYSRSERVLRRQEAEWPIEHIAR